MQGMYSQLGIGYPLTEAMHDLPIILRVRIQYDPNNLPGCELFY